MKTLDVFVTVDLDTTAIPALELALAVITEKAKQMTAAYKPRTSNPYTDAQIALQCVIGDMRLAQHAKREHAPQISDRAS